MVRIHRGSGGDTCSCEKSLTVVLPPAGASFYLAHSNGATYSSLLGVTIAILKQTPDPLPHNKSFSRQWVEGGLLMKYFSVEGSDLGYSLTCTEQQTEKGKHICFYT